MPRKPRKMSLRKADLHPAEIAFLMDDDSYLREGLLRDLKALEAIKSGERGELLFGNQTKNARELLEEHGAEALEIFQTANSGRLPSWWRLLTPEEQQALI
ncbi:MAG: hypothetical protein AB1424_10965 [Thermodesulfobacteriota bacterium]